MTKNIFLISIILLTLIPGRISANMNSYPVIPAPQFSERVNSQFVLSRKTRILYDKSFINQAYYLQKKLLRYTGIATAMEDNLNNENKSISRIVLKLSNDQRDGISNESYTISMSDNEILITADDTHGIFNGITSIIQLTRLSKREQDNILLDCWNIKDTPKYEWRGLMLDEARHFFGMEKVKQILDWMALYKMNRFHWHLTDEQGWRIEIKQYPKLTHIGGIGNYSERFTEAHYYTQEDIKEIVRYASERFIDIIPEIDMPGHASAANRAYPEFSGGGSEKHPDYTFHPGKDTVYTFLTNVLKEVDALFPSQIIHLGGDEVHYGNQTWNSDEYIQNLMKREKMTGLKEVEHYFFRRITDSVFTMNNRIAAWDEVADSDLPPEKTIVYFWRQNRLEQLQKSLDKGYSIILSPRLPMYFDYAQDSLQVHGVPWERFGVNSYDKVYNFSPNDFGINIPEENNILGIQANMWTERVRTKNRLDYMIFPRIAALAETSWTEQENKDLENFNIRLKKQFELYKEDKIYYSDPFHPKNTGEPVN